MKEPPIPPSELIAKMTAFAADNHLSHLGFRWHDGVLTDITVTLDCEAALDVQTAQSITRTPHLTLEEN